MKTNNSAPKGKEKSEKMNVGAKGGTNKMFSKMGAEPAEAGVAAPTRAPAFSKAPAKGGRTGVMGKQHGAAPAVAGQVSTGGRGGDNTFKASGGKNHMAGFTGAQNARPR